MCIKWIWRERRFCCRRENKQSSGEETQALVRHCKIQKQFILGVCGMFKVSIQNINKSVCQNYVLSYLWNFTMCSFSLIGWLLCRKMIICMYAIILFLLSYYTVYCLKVSSKYLLFAKYVCLFWENYIPYTWSYIFWTVWTVHDKTSSIVCSHPQPRFLFDLLNNVGNFQCNIFITAQIFCKTRVDKTLSIQMNLQIQEKDTIFFILNFS